MLYLYVFESDVFRGLVAPLLRRALVQRSLTAAIELGRALCARHPAIPADALCRTLGPGTAFSKELWKALVAEALVFGAVDLPRLQTSAESLVRLVARISPSSLDELPRNLWPPIAQVHFGSRDLMFGNVVYRPDAAGLNQEDDVQRLADYLHGVDSSLWHPDLLLEAPELARAEDRAEEVDHARAWWPELLTLYESAAQKGRVLMSEVL